MFLVLLRNVDDVAATTRSVACPYQFHARYVLGLAELDDVQEMIEKKDYGSLVHGVLTRFHGVHARVSALEPAAAQRELEAMSEAAIAPVVARNYLAQAWLARWKALIPGYLDWQRAREDEGWSFRAGEAERSVDIATPGGLTLTHPHRPRGANPVAGRPMRRAGTERSWGASST